VNNSRLSAIDAMKDQPEFTTEYRYPDFLCIGAQKAGTTWLDRNLRRHPGLWLPPIKETQYFNELYLPQSRNWTTRHRRERGAKMLRRYIEKTAPEEWNYRQIAVMGDIASGPISDQWYGRIFSLAGTGQVCGEVTPDYATLPEEGIRHVLKLSPDARVILSLRDPIARSWSHMRMNLSVRGDMDVAGLERAALNKDLYQRADYPAIIANWRKLIPDHRFLVVFMDDIAAEPGRVLEQVCAFLGVEYPGKRFARASEPVHVGPPQELPGTVLDVLKERMRPIYEGMAALYPEMGGRWAARYY
jgi:hypothetical protein